MCVYVCCSMRVKAVRGQGDWNLLPAVKVVFASKLHSRMKLGLMKCDTFCMMPWKVMCAEVKRKTSMTSASGSNGTQRGNTCTQGVKNMQGKSPRLVFRGRSRPPLLCSRRCKSHVPLNRTPRCPCGWDTRGGSGIPVISGHPYPPRHDFPL